LGARNVMKIIAQELNTMSPRRSGLLVVFAASLFAVALTGCQNKKKQADEVPPVSEINAEAVRERYMRTNPNNRVGVVTAVSEASHLAAVGDIPLQDFGIGDVLVFVDAREQPFNSGKVVNASATSLHVQYEANQRAPRVGELAVRLAR
jgi:hypothetical protein